jgi:hypothetical protein
MARLHLLAVESSTSNIANYRLLGIDAAEIHRAQCDAEPASAS